MILINSSIIVLVLLVILFVRPAYLGYVTYQGMKESDLSLEDYGMSIQELKDGMLVAGTNLSTCFNFNQILINQLEQSSDDLAVCNKQLSNYAVSEERYKTQINELEDEINEKENELNQYKSEYDELTKNLASKICCKMKIDNNKINYYKVEDNDIICSEDIGDEISCSFG